MQVILCPIEITSILVVFVYIMGIILLVVCESKHGFQTIERLLLLESRPLFTKSISLDILKRNDVRSVVLKVM